MSINELLRIRAVAACSESYAILYYSKLRLEHIFRFLEIGFEVFYSVTQQLFQPALVYGWMCSDNRHNGCRSSQFAFDTETKAVSPLCETVFSAEADNESQCHAPVNALSSECKSSTVHTQQPDHSWGLFHKVEVSFLFVCVQCTRAVCIIVVQL